MSGDIIAVNNLVRKYGDVVAVDDVSFKVEEGKLFGFLGPNGAGKSTTINVLCTLLKPTAGQARVNGYDVTRQQSAVRKSIGLIFQEPTLDLELKAYENIEFHARIYNVPAGVWKPRAEALLKMVDLWDRRGDLVKTFSGGMKRRLEIARGLIHQPKVLFLDEPTIGLDPQTREHIWHYLTDLREETGITLFLTTHYMQEAERCDRIAIIDYGKLIALDAPARLKETVGGDVITLRTPDNERASQQLADEFSLSPIKDNGALRFEVKQGESFMPRIVKELSVPVTSISMHRPTLEDVFLRLTGHSIRQEQASSRDELRHFERRFGGRFR